MHVHMFRLPIGVALTFRIVALLAVILVSAAPRLLGADAERQAVALRVQSTSWIAGAGFDAPDFERSCRDAGIQLVPPNTVADAPMADVMYTEAKGPGFSMFGLGQPVGYGTNISFSLTLQKVPGAEPMVSVVAEAVTPAGLSKAQFHQGALDAFRHAPAYRLSCSVIAAALGSRREALRLLPWTLMDSQAMSLLDTIGFQPETPGEFAYVAVARRDVRRVEALGAAAAEPLLLLFQNSASPRDEIGTYPAADPENATMLRRAVTILVALNDDRVPDVLATFLNDYTAYRSTGDPVVTPVLVAVVDGLGKTGTQFTLPLLEAWQDGDTRVAREARAAVKALGARLIFE